jgi:short-subunit dehydrogenase
MANKKSVVVTGAGRGIGLGLAVAFASMGWTVYPTCRSLTPALTSVQLNGGKVIDDVDVSTEGGIARLKAAIGTTQIDVLLNNAGCLSVETLDELPPDAIRRQFEVNALAPLLVTAALRPNLKRGSKVVMVTSRMGSLKDNDSGGFYGYRMSKAALNMAVVSLSKDLAGDGVLVQALHPGMVATDMTSRWGGGIPVEESVKGLMARIDGMTAANSGMFYHANGDELPW